MIAQKQDHIACLCKVLVPVIEIKGNNKGLATVLFIDLDTPKVLLFWSDYYLLVSLKYLLAVPGLPFFKVQFHVLQKEVVVTS